MTVSWKRKGKISIATTGKRCDICNTKIKAGQEFYRSRKQLAICMNCHNKRRC